MYNQWLLLLMKYLLVLFFILALIVGYFSSRPKTSIEQSDMKASSYVWDVTSIDTMKYSRDVARQEANDASFDQTIEKQVEGIAKTGATHVAIGTPYNDEFVPFMKRWIDAIRKENMHVWFRGNASGWEGWFEYPKIGRAEHTKQVVQFIKKHQELFASGDIFSSCPECENGGPGDPRNTKDKENYRAFLINEYHEVQSTFNLLGIDVAANYFSMNGDVAKLIMDKPTTKSLDGLVVIDHYVKTPDKLVTDIDALAKQSGGKIVLGEWGAPIPDIHGKMNEQDQSKWIHEALSKLYKNKNVVGLNYWTGYGSSTAIWNDDGTERKAVSDISLYFKPISKSGVLVDELNDPISDVSITSERVTVKSSQNGTFIVPPVPDHSIMMFQKDGYGTISMLISDIPNRIVLIRSKEDMLFKIRKTLQTFVP